MSDVLASIALAGLAAYVVAGLAVAVFFVLRGARRVDAPVLQAGLVFRLLIVPGLVALWPWVALRVHRGPKGQHDA